MHVSESFIDEGGSGYEMVVELCKLQELKNSIKKLILKSAWAYDLNFRFFKSCNVLLITMRMVFDSCFNVERLIP